MDNVIGLDRLIGPYKKEIKMEVIYSKDNKVVRRSRNMRGIREFVGGRLCPFVKIVAIDEENDGKGSFGIQFDNGDHFQNDWASFTVLKDAIRRWRNLYGAPLVVNGEEAGEVGFYNPALVGIDAFTKAYIECALWASTDDNEEPMDKKYTIKDIHLDSLQAIADECRDFQRYAKRQLAKVWDLHDRSEWSADEENGHDFWLTRNGHGCGFWDRGYGELGDELTRKAKSFGSSDLCVGDDDKIHVS